MNALRARGPKTVAIVLAAGEGLRTGGRKQFREAGGKSVLLHAIDAMLAVREVSAVLIVVPKDAVKEVSEQLADLKRCAGVVAGGSTRNASSRAGVAALPESCAEVLIHDAARPFASPRLIRRVLRAARESGAAVPAIEVRDSILELDTDAELRRYLRRDRLRAVQTPQGFTRELIDRAFARTRSLDFTDDAAVVRRIGEPVAVVDGEVENQKITSVEDLEIALRHLGPLAPVTPLPSPKRPRRS